MYKQIAASLFLATFALGGCPQKAAPPAPAAAPAPPPRDDTPPLDPTNIVSIAAASKDHTKLVAALKAADYVTGVANPGPLTVFAPTDAAFDKLPPGTVETLLKPENVDQLRHILQHHVVPAVYVATALKDGEVLGMVDGTNVTVHVKEGHVMIDEANVVASVRASNGVIHVVDKVLVPPAKK